MAFREAQRWLSGTRAGGWPRLEVVRAVADLLQGRSAAAGRRRRGAFDRARVGRRGRGRHRRAAPGRARLARGPRHRRAGHRPAGPARERALRPDRARRRRARVARRGRVRRTGPTARRRCLADDRARPVARSDGRRRTPPDRGRGLLRRPRRARARVRVHRVDADGLDVAQPRVGPRQRPDRRPDAPAPARSRDRARGRRGGGVRAGPPRRRRLDPGRRDRGLAGAAAVRDGRDTRRRGTASPRSVPSCCS